MLKRLILLLSFLLSILIVGSCTSNGRKSGETQVPQMTIKQVLEKYTSQWMAAPGVIGTGEGEHNGKPCIKVFVTKKTAELEKKIPAQAEGYPVVIEETGEIKPMKKG